ncbi:MAG: bifunctional DNA primase/polymerase [Actinomycetota bacterium]
MSQRSNCRNELLEHALAYAEAGWPVFPLRPGTKRPAVPNHTAEHCDRSDHRCWNGHVGWEPRATLDPARITRAWQMRPYGIGIACGPAGLVVIDLDVAKGAAASGAGTLAELEHRHGQALPATWTVATPSGGRHLYYRRPPGSTLGNTAGKAGPGIDTRACGGYVVAPPTAIAGGNYWLVDDHPPVELPSWFHELIAPTTTSIVRPMGPGPRPRKVPPSADRARRYVATAIASEQQRIAAAPEGRRNHTLFTASIAVGQLVGANVLERNEAEQALADAAQLHVTAGAYSANQARQTIASGLRRGTNEPRQLDHLTTGSAR